MIERLSLRAKLALAFGIAAAVPLVAIERLSARSVRREFERSTSANFETLRAMVEKQIAREGTRVSARVAEAARDYQLRYAIGAYEDAPRGDAHARLIEEVASSAVRLDLRLLTLVREDGRVVASAEERARFDVDDAPLLRLARARAGHAHLARIEGLEVRGPALLASAGVDGVAARYWLVGGTLIDSAFLTEMNVAESMALLLVAQGELSAAPTSAGREALQALSGGLPLEGIRETEAALLGRRFRAEPARLRGVGQEPNDGFLIATSLAPLEGALGALTANSLGLLVSGLALAWLLAYWLSRRWTDPIAALVRGFERVAAGDLEVRLGIRRGDELGRLVDAFHAMTRDLAESRARLLQAERIAAWREIARQLAHEIKNPLSPIALSMETLRRAHKAGRADFPGLLEDCTRTVLEEVDRLRRIVQEFSDFARLPRPRLVEESFHDVVRGVVSLHQGTGHRFELSLVPGEARFRFDPDQMNRLLVNLVKNAIEAAPGDGVIRISTRTEPGRFLVTVADQGPGVSTEASSRLFEPYVTSKSGGTGLGLAIVRRIAEEHGGTAVLENPGEPGARFRVELALSVPGSASS